MGPATKPSHHPGGASDYSSPGPRTPRPPSHAGNSFFDLGRVAVTEPLRLQLEPIAGRCWGCGCQIEWYMGCAGVVQMSGGVDGGGYGGPVERCFQSRGHVDGVERRSLRGGVTRCTAVGHAVSERIGVGRASKLQAAGDDLA